MLEGFDKIQSGKCDDVIVQWFTAVHGTNTRYCCSGVLVRGRPLHTFRSLASFLSGTPHQTVIRAGVIRKEEVQLPVAVVVLATSDLLEGATASESRSTAKVRVSLMI